jgi:hypothetical protein
MFCFFNTWRDICKTRLVEEWNAGLRPGVFENTIALRRVRDRRSGFAEVSWHVTQVRF